MTVDCSSIPEALAESAFYGHEKGAFTDAREPRKGYFVLADRGTLFLDEVGDMALSVQAKLLRTLEERRVRPLGGPREIPVDVRVVSATNRDLAVAVKEGRFREDLFYRLNTFTIQVPPLRERKEDIMLLAEHFLSRYAHELRKPVQGFAPEAKDLLSSYPFPGNVRELRNLMERAVILCRSTHIGPDDLDLVGGVLQEDFFKEQPGKKAGSNMTLDLTGLKNLRLTAVEGEVIREALRRCDGSIRKASKLLGISRETLRRRITEQPE